jgi:flagellar biosynthesis/type III secretory pathway protein FliH
MATTDSKRNGRFIKKSDPLHKVLTISDFSLADICETPITFHDNANANIIHEKLHVKEELAQTVRLSHEIETVFPNQEERMLIRPLDFTEEWHRLRKRQSSRNQRTDEDEDFEIEAARAEEAKQDEDDLAAIDSRFSSESAEGEADLKDSFEEVAAAPVKEAPPTQKAAPAPIMAAAPAPAPAAQPEPEEEYEEEDDFVPYASQNPSNQPNHFSTPERGLSDEELDQLRQEAREEGFRQGYQSGEERATLESRSKVQTILEEVANIVENLEGMQKSILDHAQTNFYTICKNFVESMLHKEFAMSPEIFGSFIERAVNEALNEDEFKIFVSSKVAKDLKAWSNDDLKARVRADDNLKGFDFRVEGEHSSVDGNISKVIKDLLDQADLNLFDSNKNKVG